MFYHVTMVNVAFCTIATEGSRIHSIHLSNDAKDYLYSTIDSTTHARPLNSLEHCICTTSMTNIRPGRDLNPVPRVSSYNRPNEPSGPADAVLRCSCHSQWKLRLVSFRIHFDNNCTQLFWFPPEKHFHLLYIIMIMYMKNLDNYFLCLYAFRACISSAHT